MEFTVEQLNYFRVCNIALSIVPEGLRTIFKQEWDALYTATPHGQWIDTPINYTSFYAMESKRNRSRNNRLLGNMISGDRREWDCTCLFYAIMYSDSVGPTLSPIVKTNVDDLREIRNEVAHNNDASLTDAEFQASIQKITTAFNTLTLDTTRVNEMKLQTSFPTKELDNIKQELKNIKKDLEDEKKRNAKPSCFCVLPPKPSHDTIDRMEEVGRIYEEMNRLSSEKKGETTMVYLSGNPGCGKSVLARQIGDKYFDDTTADLKFITTINASNMDTLFQSYVGFAGKLNCHPECITNIATSKDLSKEDQIIQLKTLADKQVAKYSSWLMIVDNVIDLKSFSKYWPQSERLESYVEQLQSASFLINDDSFLLSLRSVGKICKEHGKYEPAKSVYQLRLAIALSVRDMENIQKVPLISKVKDILYAVKHSDYDKYIGNIPHHETNGSVAAALNDLGGTFNKLGQYNEAKTHFDKALVIEKTAYDENHPSIATTLNNLGLTFYELGQYDEAKTHFDKALVIEKTAYDENHPSIATTLNNLGLTFSKLGQYDEAKTHFDKALVIYKTAYGESHPSIATILNNLGLTFYELGQYDEAKTHFDKALVIEKTAYGENHPLIATTLNNLGLTFSKLGQYDEAKTHYETALVIRKTAYGESHPSIATTLNNLGLTFYELGQYDEAKTHFETALVIRKTAYGEGHPSIATTLNNLGATFYKLGQYDEAKTHYETALVISKTAYGENHPLTVKISNNLKHCKS
ncbi:hypothetical protein QZH41_018639 [Actinostola sp. cb2023]|nr:hypothetical protein QZH41_018639 [Actinostola sp. cb2023]